MSRYTLILAGALCLGAVGAQAQSGAPSPNLPMNHPVMTPMAAPAPVPVPPAAPTLVLGRPSPAEPLAGVTLPTQRVGDGAYNGGGVVLEHMPDGTTRQVQ